MKHSRNEVVKNIVGSYMKRRQYCDNESPKKGDLPLSCSADANAIAAHADLESSHPNSIMYKCVNNDPTVADSQFTNLKTWINNFESVKTKEELKAVLFPMLCHIYIEMLSWGHKEPASSFLIKHRSISSEDEFELLEELANAESMKDINEKKVLAILRCSKHQVILSSETLEVLKQYLVRKSHVILLQIVNSWFDLEEAQQSTEPMLDLCDDAAPQTNGYEDHSAATSDNDRAKIEEIIRLVNDGPSSPSPLLLYSVLNIYESLTCGKVSNDGLLLAGGFTSSEIRLWSLQETKLVKHKSCPGTNVRLAIDVDVTTEPSNDSIDSSVKNQDGIFRNGDSLELLGHTAAVQDVAFLPDSNFLVSVSMDRTMRAWDKTTQTCVALYRGHAYPIWCVDASPLAGYVATGSHDRTARLWSLELNFPLRVFAGHLQDVDCLQFHPNGSYLATGSSDNTVRLWSVDTGELVRVLEGHRDSIMALAFSPDGNQIASAGDDKRIKVWDLRNSSVVDEFRGHSDSILGLDWSPNGDYLASCSLDFTSRLWSVRNISSEEDAFSPRIHTMNCNCVCSVQYSAQNTPICIVGTK